MTLPAYEGHVSVPGSRSVVTTRLRLLYAVPAALALLHAALFIPYMIDDAFITFTSAKNLARGFGPVFAQGERVEATSSLLWTLLLAPFEALGVGAPTGSKLLGALCTALVVLAVGQLFARMRPSATAAQHLSLGALVACSSTFVLWSNYGMENGLVALLLIVAIERFGTELRDGRGSLSALPIFLLETVRPEGFLFVAMFVLLRVVWVATQPGQWRTLLVRWLLLLGLALCAYELAGYLYFGHLLPNPVAAKLGESALARAKEGVRYLIHGPSAVVFYTFAGSCLIALPALLGRLRSFSRRTVVSVLRDHPWYLVTLSAVALQLFFTVSVGGDWMPIGRFVSHVAPLVLATLVCGYATLTEQAAAVAQELPGIPRLLRGAGFLVAASLALLERRNAPGVHFPIAALQAHCDRSAMATVAFLNAHGNEGDTVAASDIGYLGYHFKGRVYDWWGLANEEITALGQAIGHIDPATVLKHEPRFIVLYSNEPTLTPDTMQTGMAVYSRPFLRSAEFVRRYRQVHTVEFSPGRHHVTFELTR